MWFPPFHYNAGNVRFSHPVVPPPSIAGEDYSAYDNEYIGEYSHQQLGRLFLRKPYFLNVVRQ